ncbi:MAG TPA: hypothetical protein PLB38_04155, partial [bacterium]|nr:hypothetical protein [bacterium]
PWLSRPVRRRRPLLRASPRISAAVRRRDDSSFIGFVTGDRFGAACTEKTEVSLLRRMEVNPAIRRSFQIVTERYQQWQRSFL